MLAIIGGSGLTKLPGLAGIRRETVQTPYGEPSAPLTFGTVRGKPVAFLARHGDAHTIPPHRINYRANIQALAQAKAEYVLAVATVGGIRADLTPGTLLVPDQIIDYTYGRELTYCDGSGDKVVHVDFTQPYCEALRNRIAGAAKRASQALVMGGTYGATQGPRLESAAEIDRLERDGCDVVGMTGMPEAGLARELGLCYAAIAVVVNHAAGRVDSVTGVRLTDAEVVARGALERVLKIIEELAVLDGG